MADNDHVHGFYFTPEEEDEYERRAFAGRSSTQELEASTADMEVVEEVERASSTGTPREVNQQSHWPQSYRASIDAYSYMASPASFIVASTPGSLACLVANSRSSSFSRRESATTPTKRRSFRDDSDRSRSFRGDDSERSDQEERPRQPTRATLAEASSQLAEAQVPLLLGQDGRPRESSPRPSDKPPLPLPPQHKSPIHVSIPPLSSDEDKPRATGSSFVQAMLNGVNVLAGVGVLSTPYALAQGGWISLLLLFLLAGICCYTGLLLRRCLESRPGLATYPDIGEAAFGAYGRLVISIILYVELYACCVEFLILEGDNLSFIFPNASFSYGGYILDAKALFVMLSALFILPTVWLRDLSLLSYVSAGGVVASTIVVACVAWVGTVEGVGFHHTGSLFGLRNFPVSIGLFGFCYSGHAVFPNIYSSMADRSAYNNVLIVSFLLCTAAYAGIAGMGYTMFGDATDTQITLNLPNNLVASNVAVWTTIVNPFTKYALTMTPVAMCLEELMPVHWAPLVQSSASLLIRTMLVLSTLTVALLVPFFGFVMALIGSFLSMTVSVILPCACYLSILGDKATRMQVVTCSLMITLGAVCACFGSYASVLGIIAKFRH